MASATNKTTTGGFTLKVSFNETAVGDSNSNNSTVYCEATFTSKTHYYQTNAKNRLEVYWYDNNAYSGGILLNTNIIKTYEQGVVCYAVGTITVPHKEDGTLNGYAKAVWTKVASTSAVPPSANVQTATTSLTTISRYFSSTPNISLSSATENTATFNWSTSETCNWVRYHLDGSSNWVDVFSGNATSGSFTVSGLNANSSHTIYAECRRASSNLWSNSNTISFSTYQYPYISAIESNNLLIGNSQKLTIYNPLRRTCTIYMKQNNASGTQIYSTTSNSTTITFTPNSNILYNSIPNSKQGTAVYYCTYAGQTVAMRYGTYSIDNTDGKANPSFDVSSWSYIANLTDLTNDNQKVINNQSTITFNVNTPATAKLGASIKEYQYTWGNVQNESGSNEVIKGNGALLQVTAVDTRGYSTITQLNLENNFIDYVSPVSSSATTHRENGVETNTTIKLNGTMFNNTFGENGEQNLIESAKYYVSPDNETFSEGYSIDVNDFTYNNNYYTLNDYQIHANGTSGGFNVGTRYYLKVEITDKLDTITITNISITDGKLARDVYQDNNGDYHTGINGLASSDYALYVHGKIGGWIENYSTNETIIGTWDGKPLYRKVINVGSITLSTTATRIRANISNVDIVTDIKMTARYNNVTWFTVWNPKQLSYTTSNDNIIVALSSSSGSTTFDSCYFIIEYTKTTDNTLLMLSNNLLNMSNLKENNELPLELEKNDEEPVELEENDLEEEINKGE